MFTIGQLSIQTGITKRTIAYYEQLGLLNLPRKKGNRVLKSEDLSVVIKIFLLKISNKTISEIKCLNLSEMAFADLKKDIEVLHQELTDVLVLLDDSLNSNDMCKRCELLKQLNKYIGQYINKK